MVLIPLNLTNIRESDQGWYVCKVVFLSRSPGVKNGTWFHLDVHGEYCIMVVIRDIICIQMFTWNLQSCIYLFQRWDIITYVYTEIINYQINFTQSLL
jgi:hypothetical protein